MSLVKRNLSCPKPLTLNFIKTFMGNNHVLEEKEFKLPQGTTMCSGEQRLKLLKGTTMFIKEQMCLKFCLNIIFAYKF
jgi:hypothetical protein